MRWYAATVGFDDVVRTAAALTWAWWHRQRAFPAPARLRVRRYACTSHAPSWHIVLLLPAHRSCCCRLGGEEEGERLINRRFNARGTTFWWHHGIALRRIPPHATLAWHRGRRWPVSLHFSAAARISASMALALYELLKQYSTTVARYVGIWRCCRVPAGMARGGWNGRTTGSGTCAENLWRIDGRYGGHN